MLRPLPSISATRGATDYNTRLVLGFYLPHMRSNHVGSDAQEATLPSNSARAEKPKLYRQITRITPFDLRACGATLAFCHILAGIFFRSPHIRSNPGRLRDYDTRFDQEHRCHPEWNDNGTRLSN